MLGNSVEDTKSSMPDVRDIVAALTGASRSIPTAARPSRGAAPAQVAAVTRTASPADRRVVPSDTRIKNRASRGRSNSASF